jgi:hypothetical protein
VDSLAGVAVWDELKPALVRLRAEQPDALTRFPDPRVDAGRQPPFAITLAPWAVAAAEELYRQFGDGVDLTVGALPYPPGRRPVSPRIAVGYADLPDLSGAAADLDGPAVARSGYTLRHGLLLRNLTGREMAITTNGHVTAAVVDPETGEVVGGFSGPQILPLVTFRVPPGETGRIPLLIGTASFTPRLGYAIPPGRWGIRAALAVRADDPAIPGARGAVRERTPLLPLTVVA